MDAKQRMDGWDPGQYLKFEAQRTQPSIDLAARIPLAAPDKVVDIGCGPGNSTAVLAERFPAAQVLGVDNSAEMVTAAQKNYPAWRFEVVDASGPLDALGTGFEVVFSNACLQWIPGHPVLMERLAALLAPGGVLAVQVPAAGKQLMYQLVRELAEEEPWRDLFAQAAPVKAPANTLEPGAYFDLFVGLGLDVEIWETTYYHILPGHRDILEWYRGTGLRSHLDALPVEQRGAYETALLQRVEGAFPRQANGQVILRFPRLFMLAQKPG